MDKKTSIAMALCFAVLLVFWWLNQPTEEQRQQWQRYYDSLARVEQLKQDSLAKVKSLAQMEADTANMTDSARTAFLTSRYGMLAHAVNKQANTTTMENGNIKLTLSDKGGKIENVEIKEYKAYGDKPLMLYGDAKNTKFGFVFVHSNRSYNTNDLFFETEGVKIAADSTQSISYVLRMAEGYLRYTYSLRKESYEVDFSIEADSLGDKISTMHSNIDLVWAADMPAQEKSTKSEQIWSNLCYRYSQDDVEELNATGNDEEEENVSLDWVAFKNQFFSAILHAKGEPLSGGTFVSKAYAEGSENLKNVSATMGVKFDFRGADKADFRFIFTPNYFYTLESYEGMELTELLPLSWGIFRWINEYAIIPLFKYLEGFFSNYGIVILILTIIIKLIILPLTFSSFKSQAKMRVLKPQIDEINKKFPPEKAMERQQATMNLYKKAGINPMSGCVPMLLQMPILFAAFRFFPASIELRGESFLWAEDLSTFDSILDLPFSIPFYGDHVSLFCLLMCIAQILFTKFTMQSQNTSAMPGMSWMMYLMPVMLLFFFNDYPAGLCYYYCVSTLITVLQTIIIKRFFIDEKAILAKIEQNQKKPSKKSRFQQLYEKALAQQQEAMRQQQKGKR
ncbi:MAG: membrane protein insertase YidC [Bacteroidales bacterium]|nr:membrane protein insertase YidC [Bacteroidales bacterium]